MEENTGREIEQLIRAGTPLSILSTQLGQHTLHLFRVCPLQQTAGNYDSKQRVPSGANHGPLLHCGHTEQLCPRDYALWRLRDPAVSNSEKCLIFEREEEGEEGEEEGMEGEEEGKRGRRKGKRGRRKGKRGRRKGRGGGGRGRGGGGREEGRRKGKRGRRKGKRGRGGGRGRGEEGEERRVGRRKGKRGRRKGKRGGGRERGEDQGRVKIKREWHLKQAACLRISHHWIPPCVPQCRTSVVCSYGRPAGSNHL